MRRYACGADVDAMPNMAYGDAVAAYLGEEGVFKKLVDWRSKKLPHLNNVHRSFIYRQKLGELNRLGGIYPINVSNGDVRWC